MIMINIYRFVFILIVLALAGCAGMEQKPPEVKVVSGATALPPQKIPVLVPCLSKEEIPTPPPTWMRGTQSREKLEMAAAADLKELDQYVVKSQSLMWGCVKSLEEEKKQ